MPAVQQEIPTPDQPELSYGSTTPTEEAEAELAEKILAHDGEMI